MTDETFGDAFDTAGEADDSSNAIFRRAETLDDTKRFAEGLFHEGALYNSPVIQGETDLARAAWQKAEQMSGGHVVEAAVEGFQEVTEEKPADLWERIEPDHDLGTYAEPAIDETGTAALGSAQLGINLIENLAPGSELKPAIDLAGEGYKEFKDWAGPDDSGHFKDPEIPETDAMGANVVSDAVTAAPDTDPYVASSSDDSSTSDTSSDDTSTYDTSGASYDTSSYDTSSYDTSSYDAGSAESGGAYGSVGGDDSGSSFTDGF